jgi:hypothetical protein
VLLVIDCVAIIIRHQQKPNINDRGESELTNNSIREPGHIDRHNRNILSNQFQQLEHRPLLLLRQRRGEVTHKLRLLVDCIHNRSKPDAQRRAERFPGVLQWRFLVEFHHFVEKLDEVSVNLFGGELHQRFIVEV